jgi:peroxiredoxin
VLAVSVDAVEQNRQVAERLELGFSVLSDASREACRAFGVLHEGGAGESDIARPATFVVHRGEIVWRDLTENWRMRPRPDDVLAAVRRK